MDATRSEYRQLALSREGLKRFYRLTRPDPGGDPAGAVSLGFYLSDRLSAPLGALADGTRAVTQGDYSRQHPIYSRDELGVLTAMFNRMTKQLAEARANRRQPRRAVAANNAIWRASLVNLSAGVVAFDGHRRLTACQCLGRAHSGRASTNWPNTRCPTGHGWRPASPLVDATLAHATMPGRRPAGQKSPWKASGWGKLRWRAACACQKNRAMAL